MMRKQRLSRFGVVALSFCGALLGCAAFWFSGSSSLAQSGNAPYYAQNGSSFNAAPPAALSEPDIPALPISTQQNVQPGGVVPPAALDDLNSRLAALTPEERTPVALYAKRNKSIVNVSTVAVRSLPFFGQTEKSEGTGSGIVLNKSGVILTNFDVVENVSEMEVTLFNGETYSAELIGVDPNTDVALVKINAPEESLFPVEFGDSSNLLVGQTVYAIGNPFGLERTMTKGIISNLNRTIGSPQQFRQIKGVIQIDAAINPGNSGGALFDSRGLMIGMNTAIASRIGENTGVGFAVPVNTIHRIVSILLKDGKVVRGDVGVVQVTETEVGLIPRLIDEGGAADQAGLRGGKIRVVESRYNGAVYRSPTMLKPEGGFDIITGVDGETVKTGEDFITAVEEHGPGETITLNVLRQGAQINLPVVLK